MDIRISKDLASYLGEDKLRTVGIEWNARSYSDHYILNLGNLTKEQIMAFRAWLEETAELKVRGPKVLIRDIDTWLRALKDAGRQHARTVNQHASLLTQYLRKVPGHRVYKRLDDESKAHVAYYCDTVTYRPEYRSRDSYTPPSTELKLVYIELGGRQSHSVVFHSEQIFGMSASESLAKQGYFTETKELRAAYLQEVQRFNEIAPLIGAQFYATGYGTDNLDGNSGARWSRWASSKFPLDKSKVVMDVFYEDEKDRKDRDVYVNQGFWAARTPKALVESEDREDLDSEEANDRVESIEIPVHPFCAVFGLRRHLRLRVHVNYLSEYTYDKHMGQRLVLPLITKNLVSTLITQSKVGFNDIIEGKGLGVGVLLGGPPGVGKTLTAEVFSEASEKPLYSIQAAQLGIKADDVEANLVQFLARGSRWKAIVLIDEADVYIRARDTDMQHNAIVAAILRVLEYQTAVLFMTTNLEHTVDDAIVSRCIARINYAMPTREDQAKIWGILAALNNINLSPGTIRKNVQRHPHLAGRDIKQLLKLAVLQTAPTKAPITPEVIDFVAQFQPTIKQK